MAKFWKNQPILSWVVDDFEQFNKILSDENFDLNSYLDRYISTSFDNNISKLLFDAPFNLNLGGETKKSKLIATEKPIGVFNFSLASKTLFPKTEFYSEKLAKEQPNKFENLKLLAGIVPNTFVDSVTLQEIEKFFFKDEDGKEYECEKRIKGQTAINEGIPNARKEYGSKTKKVFQTYKRKGGKVKYLEIYSLFYYTDLQKNNDLQYFIRHLPAMMVAEYLESIGVKVRVYMTRFVKLTGDRVNLREFSLNNGAKLPMYESPIVAVKNNIFTEQLMIQPIIAKEFQQETNNPLAYLISSFNFTDVYEAIARNTINQETTQGLISVYGYPSWKQDEYWEGFERYRNKYKQYVELGLFKSKEVLPESMIFFNDKSIQNNLKGFMSELSSLYNTISQEVDILLLPEVNVFFTWWMKTSANIIKHKVDLINSHELNKDIRTLISELQTSINELTSIKDSTTNGGLLRIFDVYGDSILNSMKIYRITTPSGSIIPNHVEYINSIIAELTVFSDDEFYPTPEDEVEKRTEFKQTIVDELKKV
jgi:hypothetical protein